MATTKKTVEVQVPVRTAYDQWTQFEEFPRFMDGVESVKQLDDKRLHWKATVGGRLKEWDAEIVEQRPDEIISWRSTSGANNAGTVTCNRTGGNLPANTDAPNITIVVTAPAAPGTISNTATVSSPNDNTPGNDSATQPPDYFYSQWERIRRCPTCKHDRVCALQRRKGLPQASRRQ